MAEPEVARLLLLAVQAAGDATRAAQHQSLQLLAAKLDEGRAHSAAAADLNALTAEVVFGGLLALLGNRLLAAGVDVLPALQPELLALSQPLSGLRAGTRVRRFLSSSFAGGFMLFENDLLHFRNI